MRDAETMAVALHAAETGHLVLSTLHTLNATETVNRLIGTFPPHQEDQIRSQLSGVMQGIISQRLVIKADRKSTRLNSSHGYISYGVFCLKKKIRSNGRIALIEQDSWTGPPVRARNER